MTEKAGKAEGVTGFDEEFESLCSKMDQIKLVTERMLAQVEILIQPNPSESATLMLQQISPFHSSNSSPIPFHSRCASGGLGQDQVRPSQADQAQLPQFAGQ